MTPTQPITPKKSYRCSQSLHQFYTGGPFTVSSDGSFLVCACDDSIKIVDSSSNPSSIKAPTLEGDSEPITALCLSPNDSLLFSTSHSRQIRVWDLASLTCIRSWKGHEGPVMAMACDASGGLLATAGSDRKVRVWDVDGGFTTHYFKGHKGIVTCLMFHPHPDRLIRSGTVFYDSLMSCKPRKKNSEEQGVYFMTAGERGVVRIWNSEGAVCLFEQRVSDVAFSPDNEELRRGFVAARMLPSDQGLLCVTADQQFLFYSLMKHSEEPMDLRLQKRLIGYNEEIVDMKFMGDDEKYLVVATNLEQVRVYDLASMSCSYVFAGHAGIVLCLDTCISNSGNMLIVTGSKDNSVRLWEAESRKSIGVGTGHMGAVGAVAFSKRRRNFLLAVVVTVH